MITAERVIEALGLEPLPHEGGAFRETYRSGRSILPDSLRGHGARAARACSTQIYYLLRRGETSSLHRVRSDEVFHHYLGDRVLQIQINDGGRTHEPPVGESAELDAVLVTIGPDLERGERPQVVVPAGVWQGAELGPGPHGFALLGCTVSPGFDWEDFQIIHPRDAERLGNALPEHAELIERLTPAEGRTRA